MSGNVTLFDGLFPDPGIGQTSLWGGLFPEPGFDSSAIAPVGVEGVALLVLDLCDGTKVRYSWKTDIIKARNGQDRQRASLWDLPLARYSGMAYLIGVDARAARATLSRNAAKGLPFQFGLAFEAVSLTSDATGTTLHVPATSGIDWAVLGRRVVVLANDGMAIPAVIQDVGANSLVLNVAPGTIGRKSGTVMPTVAVLLDPQQDFARYTNPDGVEEWTVVARGIEVGYAQLGKAAQVALAGSTGGSFHDAIAVSAFLGATYNGVTITFIGDAGAPPTGAPVVTGTTITFRFRPGVTTVQNAIDALRPWLIFLGSFPAYGTTMLAPLDEFGPVALAGGIDRIYGLMGRGATLTTLDDGRAVWDRGIQVGGSATATDSMHAMTELVELGATPYGVGPANTPDWGRQLSISDSDASEWQWLKLFLATIVGRYKAFWIPTARNDLTPVSMSPGMLIVHGPSLLDGDFFGWYPALRTRLQVKLADDSVAYLSITAAVDNGNGTLSLSFTTSLAGYNPGGVGPTLTNLQLVSWLELARLESDDVEVVWSGNTFSMQTVARVVQQ